MTFYLKTIFFLKLFVSVGTLFCYKQYITWKWLKVQFLWLPSSSLSNDIGYKSFHFKTFLVEQKKLKNFTAPFYGWGSTASRPQPLWGGSLLFTTKFPEIPGAHFIDLSRMKDWVELGATQWFWARDPWIGNPEH